ncbi:MAG: DUF4105 domain-containing protein [Planctomycetaceae bacterium]|nr:DUF4105 domain-containing protein [Planctomycetales bacterium]MCB9920958.1 DUF4105 domain-containing protein [Planctomycetaceae bacterium]
MVPQANQLAFPRRWTLVAVAFTLLVGCQTIEPCLVRKMATPSNDRNWRAEQAILATAEFEGDQVTVRNIRNCSYVTEDVFIVDHYDKTFDLNDLESVDFIVVPFKGVPAVAHTFQSFGFGNGDYLAVSVEVRLEEGESYSLSGGMARQFELMYVVADERDVIQLRTKHRKNDVYVYRVRASRERIRDVFVDMLQRVNKLAEEPEFYHTLTNNCTNNPARHINRLYPGRIPPSIGLALPGLSDRLAYDLGLLETDVSFEETRRRARIDNVASRRLDGTDFSNRILR